MKRARVSRRTVLAAGALAGCARTPGDHAAASAPFPSPAAAGTSTMRRRPPPGLTSAVASSPSAAPGLSRAQVVDRYGELTPDYWGFGAPGVVRHLPTTRRVIAPTFDACGGPSGTRHLPLSVTGRSAYGTAGTRNAGQVYDEVATNQVKLTRLLGAPPRFFRAAAGRAGGHVPAPP